MSKHHDKLAKALLVYILRLACFLDDNLVSKSHGEARLLWV